MIMTHVLVGILLGSISMSFLGLQGLVLYSTVGGFFPDIDMFHNHRKTLHRPFEYGLLALVFGLSSFYLIEFALPMIFFLSAAIHSFSDILCNGKTMRPWSMKDDRAVFNHFTHKWIGPKRWFYDGSTTDLVLALILSAVIGLKYGFLLEVSVLASLSVIYSLSRRRVTELLSGYDRFSDFFRDLW